MQPFFCAGENMAMPVHPVTGANRRKGGTVHEYPAVWHCVPSDEDDGAEAPLYGYRDVDIHLVDAYSTDSELRQHNLVVLEDDKHLFPHYEGVLLMRSGSDTAKRYPEGIEALNRLAGSITDNEMREMNYQVNAEGRSARDVAKQFLTKAGLL